MQTHDEVCGKPEFYWGLNPNQLFEEVIKLIPPEQARKMMRTTGVIRELVD